MYRDLNDYEILYLISDNNDYEYGILLEKYCGLFIKIINKYKYLAKKIGYEEDDLYQICSVTLYQSLKNFDGDANNNLFYTYLLKSLDNAILNVIKTNNTNKKKVLNDSISYDTNIPNSTLTYVDIFPDPKTQVSSVFFEYGILYMDYKNSFEFDVSCIFELKVEGYTNHEIATLLSLSYNEVLEGMKKIRNRVY